jgi:sphingomyelin phosphodiesterase
MHISDIHLDLFYSEGSPARCNEPVCCRDNVTALANSTKAGRWGSLSNCDLPLKTFNLFLEQVSKMPIDLVLWTGDNTAHDVWQQTQDYNLNFSVLLTDLMKNKLKARVIPSAGNHESAPVNVYDFQGKRENFLNDGLATSWYDWIGKDASDMYRKNGFYSVFIKELNMKMISLNTQAGNDDNWFLLRDPTDPGGQLAWL